MLALSTLLVSESIGPRAAHSKSSYMFVSDRLADKKGASSYQDLKSQIKGVEISNFWQRP